MKREYFIRLTLRLIHFVFKSYDTFLPFYISFIYLLLTIVKELSSYYLETVKRYKNVLIFI